MPQKRSRLYQPLSVILLVFLVACSGPSKLDSQQTEIQRPVWPKPPEQPRIEFVQNISAPEDLGIRPGFWSRLLSVFVGSEQIHLIRPTSVVMSRNEVMYVADPGLQAVHRFDIHKKEHELLKLDGGTSFRSPISLALDPEDRVYVSDSALDQIFVLDPNDDKLVPFKTSIPLDQPTGLAFDAANDRLLVVNTHQHQVLAFSPQGELVLSFGSRGVGDKEFNYPTQIWSDPGTGDLWVTDSLNFRIQRFSADGEFISTFAGIGDATGNLARPKGIATDGSGHVYIVDGLFNNMQIFNQSGDLLLHLGEQGDGIGQFWLPVGIYINKQNRIFIADSFNKRIQVFRYLETKG